MRALELEHEDREAMEVQRSPYKRAGIARCVARVAVEVPFDQVLWQAVRTFIGQPGRVVCANKRTFVRESVESVVTSSCRAAARLTMLATHVLSLGCIASLGSGGVVHA